jgi:hypothetical protein
MIKLPYKILLCAICVSLQFILSVPLFAQAVKTSFKFDFGSGKTASGYQKVSPDDIFNDVKGYGFDFGSEVRAVTHQDGKKLTDAYITGDKPFISQ